MDFFIGFFNELNSEGIGYNGLALCEEADFEALNCQPSTKVGTR